MSGNSSKPLSDGSDDSVQAPRTQKTKKSLNTMSGKVSNMKGTPVLKPVITKGALKVFGGRTPNRKSQNEKPEKSGNKETTPILNTVNSKGSLKVFNGTPSREGNNFVLFLIQFNLI